jgi:hypothetical protein
MSCEHLLSNSLKAIFDNRNDAFIEGFNLCGIDIDANNGVTNLGKT